MSVERWCTLPAGVAQVCAEQLDLELPFPLRLPAFGTSPEERRELVADAGRFLAEAGLRSAAGLDPTLVEQLRDTCAHTHGFTLVLRFTGPDGEPAQLRALAAQHAGRWVLAVLQDDQVHLGTPRAEPDGHPVADLLALLPPAVAPGLRPAAVPGGAVLAEAGTAWDERGVEAAVAVLVRAGADRTDARSVLEVHTGAAVTGQLSVQSTLPGRSRRAVGAAPVTVVQGPLGRYALLPRADGWVAQLPDGPHLVAQLAEHLDRAPQVDPLVRSA